MERFGGVGNIFLVWRNTNNLLILLIFFAGLLLLLIMIILRMKGEQAALAGRSTLGLAGDDTGGLVVP